MQKQFNKRVGLYFGSFNPIHIGHLVVAKSALEFGLDEVWFVVSPVNPYKQSTGELEDEYHRLEMVKLAISDEPSFKACDVEFRLPKPSYTHVALEVIRSENPDTRFTIIGGTDLQLKLSSWKSSKDIILNHDLIIYPRELTGKDLNLKPAHKSVEDRTTYMKDVPKFEISATHVRNQIKNGNSIKYLVPDSVIEYINKNGLFLDLN